MSATGKYFVSKRVLFYELSAFIFIIFLIWFDEFIDLPSLLLGAEKTPVNWEEASFESFIIAALGAAVIWYTDKLFRRMTYLEGILPICASCKKIRDDKNAWHHIESYIHERSAADFSHSICPECAAKLYPEFNPYEEKTKDGPSGKTV